MRNRRSWRRLESVETGKGGEARGVVVAEEPGLALDAERWEGRKEGKVVHRDWTREKIMLYMVVVGRVGRGGASWKRCFLKVVLT